jgi:hypothetical protein
MDSGRIAGTAERCATWRAGSQDPTGVATRGSLRSIARRRVHAPVTHTGSMCALLHVRGALVVHRVQSLPPSIIAHASPHPLAAVP